MFAFPKANRLTKTDEISSVFRFRCRVSGVYLQALAGPNTLDRARLTAIVSKKVAASAVARNYMKRSIRETFRCTPHLPRLDIVVQVRKRFGRGEREAVDIELGRLFAALKKCLG